MGWTVRGSNPGRSKRFFLFSKTSRPALGPTQPSIHWVPSSLPGRSVTLTTHLHLVPRLRMNGVIPLRRLYAFMVWRGKTVPFILCYIILECRISIWSRAQHFLQPFIWWLQYDDRAYTRAQMSRVYAISMSVTTDPSGRSLAEIAGSNPAGDMDGCLLCCQVEVSATG